MQQIEGIMYQSNAPKDVDPDSILFVQVDADKCEGCGECNYVCPTGVIQSINDDDIHGVVDPAACVNCGQCLTSCPVGAIYEGVSYLDEIVEKLKDPDTVVVSMPAPAVRYGLGECFGAPTGTYVGGKMHAALRELGFDYIWDTEFAADVTIMEEGTELIQRVKGEVDGHPLPQFTSCCPGWIKFAETFYPDLAPNLSTCKSPIAMLGALAKTYGAKETKTDPKKIYTVSIMPCIAKKYEGLRPELNQSGFRDIDATINTRELAYLIKEAGIEFNSLPDQDPDPILGESTGAATIFGNSGGVMEAALRLGYEALSGNKLDNPEIKVVRAHEGIKTADIEVPNFGTVKVAVASGLKNAAKLCDEVRAGKSPYHFIEIMTCPGGCVNGGGQPLDPEIQASMFRSTVAKINKRFRTRKPQA
ncbi:Periplasmic [Fe] hydrogenase large subunit [Pseudodesulfovibrio profundus]|uniref:Periplasmic [Fe] hydrogenase large subunit n=1 Tax=Pseudodesulfovibrio profundus TaxID=57320 RepID=A0A2C8F682_9BACT|nr:[FeFe] hydrogenase, group A [Pseudodesulfovibrio profundus]MBC18561.1 iron hydrogenase [Desulfovibrio sp.]SOB57886.1 Periplasmic [Fe] hydrogenase large subunit [Pseudodesulfovibrio profundus]|tara:strand:+ start:4823 stop:6076 length:1254 start_codon:yes stop_codon:yes gene_type:complete